MILPEILKKIFRSRISWIYESTASADRFFRLPPTRIYKLRSVLLFVQTIHTSRARKRIVSRMATTGKMWKSDDFRKFMKVRLHNSFPRCDALCSRDVVTWNLRPLPLFSREQQRVSLFRCAVNGFALYNVFRKSCIENGGIFYVRKRRFQKVFPFFGENTTFDAPKDLYLRRISLAIAIVK